ncbi:C-1-tetrahydrofolate synthase, cytoplasmic isoform X2 [Hydra vulgaris]|uniref:C-1-tetrahydrofolate synthase, cytoplasmic isoform X2 n=1 Tax=Hydra vulgaris TaxID=6087 RepID=A0ABM4C151_HYDVU
MANILDGKELARKIRSNIKLDVEKLISEKGVTPGLRIVQVGNREDSNVYVRTKLKFAQELGMNASIIKLPDTVTESELIHKIHELNDDPLAHGIIVQLPLDCKTKITTFNVTNAVIPEKDVDGINDVNAGRLARGQFKKCFVSCTPAGCMELIKSTGINITGLDAVVLGRSTIVGSPMANLLTWHDATVTICHSRTRSLKEKILLADILVAAVGVPELVKGDWLKPGAIVIDVGISAVPDATKKKGQRLVGDVDYLDCAKKASWITPVPGGVGPMTVAMLLSNTVESCKQFSNNNHHLQSGFGLSYSTLMSIKNLAKKIRF